MVARGAARHRRRRPVRRDRLGLLAPARSREGRTLRRPGGLARAWRELAAQLEHLGAHGTSAGHHVSASDFSLRASVYYQWAEGLLDPDDARAHAMYGKHLDCFADFASQRSPAIEIVDIPFGEQVIPAYVVPAAPGHAPGPACLLSTAWTPTRKRCSTSRCRWRGAASPPWRSTAPARAPRCACTA
jgi:hypothetical protein